MSTAAPAANPLVPGKPLQVAAPGSRVAVIIVTWNRREAVSGVLAALARQSVGPECLHVAVIDNSSSDRTAELLTERWRPDATIDNPTDAAHRPAFTPRPAPGGPNAGGFASLTLIVNRHNLGGCGGFNTGLAWAEQLDPEPVFAWLVDDDVDLPTDALERLVATARSDPSIGLVGSRTVDFADRATTIETTIYFDRRLGHMAPEPPPGHPLRDSHLAWVAHVGGTRGNRAFTGRRDVDVLSACSLLARWEAVKRVGFWDRRYFIYCDDADWCLRFARAGYRVVLDLDAVVYHTYWLAKLTPARAYYAERNLAWMCRKSLAATELRRATRRKLAALLLHSRKAATHCRLFHAEILRRTVYDTVRGRGGKLDAEGPTPRPLLEAIAAAGALRAHAEVVVMCAAPHSVAWADELRARVAHALLDSGEPERQPRWTYIVAPGIDDPAAGLPNQPRRLRYEPNRTSKWRAQRDFLRRAPDATVVFDQSSDFPLVRSRWNLHLDRRTPHLAQLERDSVGLRARFFARWLLTAARAAIYALTVRPRPHKGKYG